MIPSALPAGGSTVLALAFCGLVSTSAIAQGVAAVAADLPVTRLQGGPPATVIAPPAQQPPGRPRDLSALPVTELDVRVPAADLDGPRRIALSLARPLPLEDMLLLLLDGTPFSIVTDESVRGTFSGDLKDLTMRQALEAVLFPRDLDYEVRGTLIRVSARRPATRLFDINLVNQRRTWQRAIRSTGAAGGEASATELVTSGISDPLDELNKGIQSLLSATGQMHLDRTAGLVQVTDFSDRLDRVSAYIDAVQLRAGRQVRIDARVLEVTLSNAASSIDWNAALPRTPGTTQSSEDRMRGVEIPDADAFVRALGEQGLVRTIASPRMITLNNEPAAVRVGLENVYAESYAPATAAHAARGRSPASAFEGLILTITPQIASDGNVQLSVAPSYASRVGDAKSAAGEADPVLHVSEADMLVSVHDGDTVVVSGFLNAHSTTKPVTGLGSYFGARSQSTATSELVILLTPVVLAPAASRTAMAR